MPYDFDEGEWSHAEPFPNVMYKQMPETWRKRALEIKHRERLKYYGGTKA